MRSTFIVTYDIADDKRLRKVFKTMKAYGDHLQFSVFECQMSPSELIQCRQRLTEIINHAHDQILFIELEPSEGRGDRVITSIGQAYQPFDAPCMIV
jgi:CRISPR-associated protein Cas2